MNLIDICENLNVDVIEPDPIISCEEMLEKNIIVKDKEATVFEVVNECSNDGFVEDTKEECWNLPSVINTKIIQCPQCDFRGSYDQLEQHTCLQLLDDCVPTFMDSFKIFLLHSKLSKKSKNLTMYECTECNYKTKIEYKLKQHISMHKSDNVDSNLKHKKPGLESDELNCKLDKADNMELKRKKPNLDKADSNLETNMVSDSELVKYDCKLDNVDSNLELHKKPNLETVKYDYKLDNDLERTKPNSDNADSIKTNMVSDSELVKYDRKSDNVESSLEVNIKLDSELDKADSGLESHVELQHKKPDMEKMKYDCRHCDYKTNFVENFRYHLKRKHCSK